MKNLKNKKGISLIVLILTIIVMIILATAIILSLNNSGIIGKANKAKRASDYASLKEYANVLQAEYELMSDKEKENTGYDSSIDYANAKLEAEGYKQRLNADGILLSEGAVKALADGIETGHTITGYNSYLTAKTAETSGKENTAPTGNGSEGNPTKQNVSNKTDFAWKYVGVSDNGEIMIMPVLDENSPTIQLSGKGGYSSGPNELNDMCEKLYGSTKGTARSINIEDVRNITGNEEQEYWYMVDYHEAYSEPKLTISQLEEKYNVTFSDTLLPDDVTDLGSCTSTLSLANLRILDGAVLDQECSYWVANSYMAPWVFTEGSSYVGFGIWTVSGRDQTPSTCSTGSCLELFNPLNAAYGTIFNSKDWSLEKSYALLPIVTLNSDVTLTKTGDGTWSIN